MPEDQSQRLPRAFNIGLKWTFWLLSVAHFAAAVVVPGLWLLYWWPDLNFGKLLVFVTLPVPFLALGRFLALATPRWFDVQ